MPESIVPILRQEIAQLEAELSSDLRFVKWRELKRLIALYETSSDVHADTKPTNVFDNETVGRRNGRKSSPERERILNETMYFIEDLKVPTPTRDILEHLTSIGIAIPGESPLNNLSAMLSNSSMFHAVGRSGWIFLDADNAKVVEEAIKAAVGNFVEDSNRSVLVSVYETWQLVGKIPPDVDGKLLSRTRSFIGRDLTDKERDLMRTEFVDACRIYN